MEFKQSGVSNLINGENGEETIDPKTVTLKDLIDTYGEEVVKRGMGYMESLEQADKNFRESVEHSSGEYSSSMYEAYTGESEEEDHVDNRWERGMKKKGIGIDDE